jgi:hypothetical protein
VVPQEGNLRYGALFEHNGQRYRLLRDLSGGINLARLNPASQKFELVAKDEASLTNFLQDELDFPLEGLFALLGLADRNANVASAGPSAQSSYATSQFDAYTSQQYDEYESEPAANDVDIESQLKQLRRELSVLSSVDDLEFKVDGLQKKKFETEANLAKYKEFATRTEKLEKRAVAIQPIESLTPELESRVRNLQKTEEYQRQKLSALDKEIHEFERELDVLEPKAARKFQKDPFFIAGAVVALLGFILPFFTKEFLVLFGFAGMGWLGYLFVMVYPKTASHLEEVNRKYKQKIAEEEKVKKDFDTATAAIRDLVKKLQVIDAKDLLEVAEEWRTISQDLDAIKADKAELDSRCGSSEKVQGDLLRQEAEIALFEEELRNAGAITRDAIQLQAEIKRLEAIRDAGGASSMAPAASVAVTPAVAQSSGSISVLLDAAARLSRTDLDHVLSVGVDKVNTYLRALTGGKLGPAEVTVDGHVSLNRSDFGSQRFTLEQLSDGARATFMIALRLGLWELILPTRQFPILLDDPFSLLDDQRQAVAGKALKRISGLTQVIHFTSQKSFLALADHKVELK